MVLKLLDSTYINKKKAFRLLAAMHIAGIVGLLIPETQALFQSLTPFNLLVSAAIIFYFQQSKTKGFYLFLAISMLIGYSIEVAGVKTGVIFGEYAYGETLGLKLFSVPLIIGVNWAVLVYASGNLASSITKNIWLCSLIGALVMAIMDVLIEPVAIRFDFWQWGQAEVPFQNYLAWFGISFILHLIFQKLAFDKNNSLAIRLLYLQLLFFGMLNLF